MLGADYKPADAEAASGIISGLILPGVAVGNTPCMETIGQRVKALREAQDPVLSQTDLAKKIGVHQPTISMIEDGKTKTLSGKVLAGLCEHLSTTPSYILSGAGHKVTKERAMQLAELSKLAQDLPAQALTTLLDNARMVAQATAPVVEPPQPPIEKMRSTGRVKVSDIYRKRHTVRPAAKSIKPKGKVT